MCAKLLVESLTLQEEPKDFHLLTLTYIRFHTMEEMHSQKQVIVREEAKEEEDAQNVNNIYSSITQLSNMFYGL